MVYTPTQAPPNLRDHDELRKWVEEEFRRLAQAYAEMDRSGTTGSSAAIAKLTNNQFARVSLVTAAQTGIAASTDVLINFNSTDFDPSGIWNSTSKRFVPTVAGYYSVQCSAQLSWGAGNATALNRTRKNGAQTAVGSYLGASFVNASAISKCSDMIHVNGTTDYIDFAVYCDGSASRDIAAGSDRTFATIQLVKAD